MSSHHVVVSTTVPSDPRQRTVRVKRTRWGRTSGGELGVETLSHDALETHAGADEADGDEREGVAPCGVTTVVCDAARVALPDGDGGDHGEECLDESAEGHPHAGLAPNLVAKTSDE